MAAPIQKELRLTEKQKSQLKKLDTTMSQKRRQMFTRSRQRNTDPEKMRTSMDSLRREQEEAISNILEPKQKTRLGEIELQREGIFAVARTDVAKKLKLTSTQTAQIKPIVDLSGWRPSGWRPPGLRQRRTPRPIRKDAQAAGEDPGHRDQANLRRFDGRAEDLLQQHAGRAIRPVVTA